MDTLWTVVITQLQSIAVGKHFIVMIIKLLNLISQILTIHLLPIYCCTGSFHDVGLASMSRRTCVVVGHMCSCPVIVGCLARPWRMGADRLPWCRHICLSLNYRSRNRHRNLWDRQCVSSWWPLVWFEHSNGFLQLYIYMYVFIYNCVSGSCIGCTLYLCVCWWGKGWPVVACPSRTLVVLYRMLTIFTRYILTNVWDAVFTFIHLPRMFLSTDLPFANNGLNKMPWTSYISYLHAILRIISRGVSGLATGSPCGVWGRGWTTCLLRDSPLFGLHFKMTVGM